GNAEVVGSFTRFEDLSHHSPSSSRRSWSRYARSFSSSSFWIAARSSRMNSRHSRAAVGSTGGHLLHSGDAGPNLGERVAADRVVVAPLLIGIGGERDTIADIRQIKRLNVDASHERAPSASSGTAML